VIFQASAPRISNAAGLIDLVAAGDLAAAIASAEAEGLAEVTASAAVEDPAAAVIASAVEDSVAAALADLVVEGSAVFAAGADEINAWNFPILFLEKAQTTNQPQRKI
jgi:hypothetical protein